MTVAICTDTIKELIHIVRERQVMIDTDLARLYAVKTKRLNEQVRRNKDRFPDSFMFQLSKSEKEELVAKCDHLTPLKFSSTMPFVFTEQGVAMLSAVLKSEIAIKVSIQIIEAFISMRKFMLTHMQLFQRMERNEQKLLEHDTKFDELFNLIEERELKPEKGIFFEGQIFEAYKFVSDLIRSAHMSIVLIDNYIDDSVLTLLSKRKKEVKVIIFTKEISKQLALDVVKYNLQYPPIEVREFKEAHDRFLIIDDTNVYHFGASLKDFGKKWFGFSKFDKEAVSMLEKLGIK